MGHCNTIVRRRMTLLCVQVPTTHLAARVAAEKVNMAALSGIRGLFHSHSILNLFIVKF